MSEIIYKLTYLPKREYASHIRWLTINDFNLFNRHLAICNQKIMTIDTWNEMFKEGTMYFLLYVKDSPIGRGGVEKYSDNAWEAADIRVAKDYRNRGYGKEILYFLSEYILKHVKTATCRTEEDNFPMKRVIASMGYTKL